MFDEKLCDRSKYLPMDYIFSVRVYEDQFLHIRNACLNGVCTCLYYLDGIPTVLRPCQFAVLMYKNGMWTDKDLWVLKGVCQGFCVVDGNCDLSYKMHNYKSILAEDMQKQMCSNISKELFKGQVSCLALCCSMCSCHGRCSVPRRTFAPYNRLFAPKSIC